MQIFSRGIVLCIIPIILCFQRYRGLGRRPVETDPIPPSLPKGAHGSRVSHRASQDAGHLINQTPLTNSQHWHLLWLPSYFRDRVGCCSDRPRVGNRDTSGFTGNVDAPHIGSSSTNAGRAGGGRKQLRTPPNERHGKPPT